MKYVVEHNVYVSGAGTVVASYSLPFSENWLTKFFKLTDMNNL